MGSKATPYPRELAPLPWRRPEPEINGLEVRELYGEEADAQWAAAFLNLYLDPHERAFATTAPAPLL